MLSVSYLIKRTTNLQMYIYLNICNIFLKLNKKTSFSTESKEQQKLLRIWRGGPFLNTLLFPLKFDFLFQLFKNDYWNTRVVSLE